MPSGNRSPRPSPRPLSGCRQLLGYALALCEARVHPERLERLLALARQMQDQDPHSKNWGNLSGAGAMRA